MNMLAALRCATFGPYACLIATVCPAASAPLQHVADGSWLSRTLVAREAALSRAYNTCNLHALRASLFAGTTITTPEGQRIDPVIEARDRLCGRRHRQVMPGSLSVRAVGDDSALVIGRQRFCVVGVSPCAERGSTFAQLWTLDRGLWRLGWMRRFTDAPEPPGQSDTAWSGVAASHVPDAKGTNGKAQPQGMAQGTRA